MVKKYLIGKIHNNLLINVLYRKFSYFDSERYHFYESECPTNYSCVQWTDLESKAVE